MHNLTKPYLLRCKGGLTIDWTQLVRLATLLLSVIKVRPRYSYALLDQRYS